MHTLKFKYKLKTPKAIRNNPDQTQQNALERESILKALDRFDEYSLDGIEVKYCRGGRIITISLKRNLNA